MIRDRFYKDILATLDRNSRFDSSDFKIDTVKDSRTKDVTLKIVYSLDPRFKITFQIPSAETFDKDSYTSYYKFSGSVSPGPLAFEESFTFKGEHGIYERLNIWLTNIWEELTASPVVKQLENQQEQIDEIFQKFTNIKDEYFTREESNDLKERLDQLESQFKAELEKHLTDKKELESKLNDLTKDIETLKLTVDGLKKPGWLKSFTTKVFKWTKNSENRKLLKGGYDMARQLLPEEYKQVLPEIKD